MKCPNCNKDISTGDKFCSRCGNDLKGLSSKNENTSNNKIIVVLLILAICLIVPKVRVFAILIALVVGIVIITGKRKANKPAQIVDAHAGMIQLTDDAIHYEKMHYKKVKAIYQELGFKNIETVNRKDIVIRLLAKPGIVESVTIKLEEPETNKWYNPKDKVVITYHGVDDEKYVEDMLPFYVNLDIDN